jgi:predicted membrane-bound spermidine synthase
MNLHHLLASRKNLWLFSIIFIEGYVVLATELLAIRLLVPFVGSGTEVISIIISAVLLPLAIGYHHGSMAHKRSWQKARLQGKKYSGLRTVILRNLLKAMAILVFGLSYFFLEMFFYLIEAFGGKHALLKAAIYSSIFLVYPVYLLGQTIPIMSNYFSKKKLSEATGAVLFFSTMGSFLGSVFSTLVLMMLFGVHNTVIITLLLLTIAIVSIRQKFVTTETIIAFILFIIAYSMNKSSMFEENNIYSNNAYSIISVQEDHAKKTRTLSVNRSNSSRIGENPEDRFGYIAYIEDNFIYTYNGGKPLEVLVIGAGGFTLGLHDSLNRYDYVDIDPALKEVSEKYFLQQKVGSNKNAIISSARAFLASSRKKYDLIVIDAYTNLMTIPAECTTREFFAEVRSALAPDGAVVANFIISPDNKDLFSVRLANTFGSVFPVYQRQVIGKYAPWTKEKTVNNNLFIFINRKFIDDRAIYTDDRNTYSLDKY